MNSNIKYISDLQRRLNNLIRIGTVAETQGNRLKVKIGDNTTGWLKWLTSRAGDCQTWWRPSIGEQVLVLSPSGEFNNGIVLPSIYTDNQPETDPNKHLTKYKDGTIIEYDYQAKKLNIDCVGEIQIDCVNDLSINSGGEIKITGAKSLDIDITTAINIKTPAQVTIDSPETTITGNLTVGSNLNVSGQATVSGKLTTNNDLTVSGKATVTGDVIGAGKSLSTHVHIGNVGAPTSPPS